MANGGWRIISSGGMLIVMLTFTPEVQRYRAGILVGVCRQRRCWKITV